VKLLLPQSLRQQLLLFALLGLSLLSIFCIPLWSAWNTEIEAGRADVLRADAMRMQQVFAMHGPAELAKVIDERVGIRLDRTRQVLLLVGPDGRRIAGNIAAVPSSASRSPYRTVVIPIDGGTITVELFDTVLPNGYTVWVGRDISRFVRLETMFVRGMIGSAAIALLAAAVTTVAAQRATRNRIHGISRAANEIMAGNLARRLPVPKRADEFEQLAATVNRMLDQIEHLVDNVRQSSNAIAHDLRTPLAELRAHLEHLAVTQPAYDVVQDGLDEAITDIDRVIGIFNAILRLAEIDSGIRRAGFHTFDLPSLVSQANELYEPLAEERGVILEKNSQAGLTVNGDPVLLAQALANLIENAQVRRRDKWRWTDHDRMPACRGRLDRVVCGRQRSRHRRR
jgi:signal transduction histidine kinase